MVNKTRSQDALLILSLLFGCLNHYSHPLLRGTSPSTLSRTQDNKRCAQNRVNNFLVKGVLPSGHIVSSFNPADNPVAWAGFEP